MSTDLLTWPEPLRAYPRDTRALARIGNSLPGPVRHVVIIFGGWGSSAAGQPLRPVPDQPTGTSELLETVQALGTRLSERYMSPPSRAR
jgi:hypothetical protein